MKKVYLIALFFLTVLAGYAQRAPFAINDVATVVKPDSVVINVLANDSNYNLPDSVCITSVWGGQPGWATILSCSKIRFQALDRQFYGVDTFYYSSCNTAFAVCDTGRVIVTIRPRGVTDRRTLIQRDTILIKPMANDSNSIVNDSMCISSIWLALGSTHTGWARLRGCDSIIYHPTDSTYYGLDSFFYRSCSVRTPSLCDTGRVIVNILFLPKAAIDTVVLQQPDTAFADVLVNDTNYNRIDTTCIKSIWGPHVSWAQVSGCGQIVFHPIDYHYRGVDTIYYRACYTNAMDTMICDTGKLVIKTILPLPNVDFVYNEGINCQVTAENQSSITDSVHWSIEFLTQNGTDTTIGNANTINFAAYQDSAFEAEVCMTGYNPSGDSTICYTFWIQCAGSNGIHDLTSESMRIYPNPASGEINIDLSGIEPSGNTVISIYDMVGKQLISKDAENHMNINIRDLSDGLYLMCLTDKGGKRKVISKFEVIH